MFAGKGQIGQTGSGLKLSLAESLALAIKHKFSIFNQRHAMLGDKGLCALAHEIHMMAFFKHKARGLNRIFDALHAGYTTGEHPRSVHEQSIHLHAPIAG